jgi:glutamate/tyrosine decarboxylase-like PLP-dependent enzyme
MTAHGDAYDEALARAFEHARSWLSSIDDRPIGPRATADELVKEFGGPLPESGMRPADVVDELATRADAGLMAMPSGRFFGWVIGGTLPAGLAADWLVSAWDQNAGMRYATPAVAAIEEAAAQWLLELLLLPADADVGFVTGATMANFTCLAAARYSVLQDAGWDVNVDGLSGAPKIHVVVGEERHGTIDIALRYLGLGAPVAVTADDQGRISPDALAQVLEDLPNGAPVIVCLQAGNLHSGAFDPFAEAIAVAHQHGAWVHVDGAFGLWAAASPKLRHLTKGVDGADSWTTDAHKTLNVPYDCGVAIVRDSTAMRSAFGLHTSYLISDETGRGDPYDRVPELSRRARGVPVWAVLRSLGRDGVAQLVDQLATRAGEISAGIAEIDGVEVLNEVVYTQICAVVGDSDRTAEVAARLVADGTAWMSPSVWRGQDVLRISVSNWSTDDEDVRRSVEALRRAVNP